MKAFGIIVKLCVALAAVAGLIYALANYGDKMVAWAKKIMSFCRCNCKCEVIIEQAPAQEAAQAPAEAEAVAAEGDFEG